MDLTNFYYPGLRERLMLSINPEMSCESDGDVQKEKVKVNEKDAITGFVGTMTGDIPYQCALEYFECYVEFEELIPTFEQDIKNPIEWAITKNRSPLFYSQRKHISD